MENKKMTSVAVSTVTREQLNDLRGVYSVDEYLKNVLLYLRLYRIDPMRRDVSPNQDVHNHYNDVMKRIEDVIKIIRSAEKGIKETLQGAGSREGKRTASAKETQMQDTIDNLRRELASNENGKEKEALMKMYQMIVEFIDGNLDGDGCLFVGKTRANQFKSALKEVYHD